jgi:uncharacterized phage protein gp47/JayE
MPRTVNGFEIMTLAECVEQVRGDLQSRFPGEDPFIRGSVWWVVGAIVGGAVYILQTMLALLAKEGFVSTASEAYLAIHAAEYAVPRNQPTACVATFTATWTAGGNDIPAAAQLVAADGTIYVVDAPGVLDPGGWYPATATGTATAQTTGVDVSVGAGAVLTLVVPIAGITDATVVASAVAGTDLETVEDWRERVLERKANIPHAGTEADIRGWAMDVDGVDAAYVRGTVPGPGDVTIYVDPTHKATDVENAVQDLICVTATVYGIGVTAYDVIASIDGYLETGASAAAVRQAIEDALESLYEREAGNTTPGTTVRNSDIREAISSAEGLAYFVMPSLNGDGTGLSDIVVAFPDVPTVGIITWGGDL